MIAKLILIGLPLIGLGINIARHGEDKNSKYNGWAYIIYIAINYTLYYYAGVFN